MAASLFNQFTTANSPGFKARVEMALMRYAVYLDGLRNDPNPPSAELLAVASKVMGTGNFPGGGQELITRMSKVVAADSTLETKVSKDVSGAEVTDADLDTAVQTHFLKLA